MGTPSPSTSAALVPSPPQKPGLPGVDHAAVHLDTLGSAAPGSLFAQDNEEHHTSRSRFGTGQHQPRRDSTMSAPLGDVACDVMGLRPLTVEPTVAAVQTVTAMHAAPVGPVLGLTGNGLLSLGSSSMEPMFPAEQPLPSKSVRVRRLGSPDGCSQRYAPVISSASIVGEKRPLLPSPHASRSCSPLPLELSPLPGARSPTGACYPPSAPRSWLRSSAALAEFESFTWPLVDVAEVRRLLACRHIAPTWLLLGDATASWAARVERTHGVIALVVDRHSPSSPCLCYRGEFQDILPLQTWDCICAWPSCTHQAISNARLLEIKRHDGRMFFGLIGVLYVMFQGSARVRMVEQPVTTMSRYFKWPTHHLRTSHYGDSFDKAICLRFVGLTLRGMAQHRCAPSGPLVARVPHWAFATADERESYRSSWQHFPLFLLALALCLTAVPDPSEPPSFSEAVESLAVAWHHAGLPVPPDYDSPDGLPISAADRAYLQQRGPGDGRLVHGVVPRSLRTVVTEPIVPPPDLARLAELQQQRAVLLTMLTTHGFMLFFMSTMVQPLIYASLSGIHVIGAELPLSYSPRSTALPIMEKWASHIGGASAAATTFLIGHYSSGPRVGVTILHTTPDETDIARTPNDVQRLRRYGRTTAWLTFAALASFGIADPAARVFAGTESFVRPVSRMSDFMAAGDSFVFGSTSHMPLQTSPRLMLARTPRGLLLAKDAADAILLRTALLERAAGADAVWLEGWAERIRPPNIDLQAELIDQLPDFADPTLLDTPYAPPYVPPHTVWLPRMPPQRPRATPFCVRDPFQMLVPRAQSRLTMWLGKVFDQLLCIERQDENCELLRPHPLALGQGALHPWARGVIWDLTFERAPCAVPLDLTLPLQSGLQLHVLQRRLSHYPDQELLSHLIEGVRLGGDVELQTVLVPHLISLPKGFVSVRQELYRLQALDWYRFFSHIPFWPMSFNGQGAAARKHSTRYRRSTECGGPRKECLDETGLAALSLNDAATRRHFPRWYSTRLGEPEWDAWLEIKGLLDASARGTPSPVIPEIKPTLWKIMHDFSILLAAGRLLDEPVYIFGDDARDHFNQLALSPEAWNQLGVIFLHEPSDLFKAQPDHARLFFVSERRLGFGAKRGSLIAQRFSEAVLTLLREDMDAAEAAQVPDMRPSALAWRERRAAVAHRGDGDVLAASRLYLIEMYTDDALMGVVGLERALRLLITWQRLVASIGLLMAPPEKRNIGTWAPWLGILIFAGIGLVIVPKDKLLRTTERLSSILRGQRTEFSEYRSLIGMLEHLRCVNCAPSSVMYGLYAPHRSTAIRLDGPSTFIKATPFLLAQLQNWIDLLRRTGGAVMTAAIRAAATVLAALTYVISSDAATDSQPPGMGGFCHGLYWHLEIKPEWLEWLHITDFELLATAGSALTFLEFTRPAERRLYLSDALATPYVLSRHKARSDTLTLAHHELLRLPRYLDAMFDASIAHFAGDCNVFSDAVSRSLWKRFRLLCLTMGVRPQQVPVAAELTTLIEKLVTYAKATGRHLRPNVYVRGDPVLPPAMLALGRRSAACEEADAVAISARLLRRMHNPLPIATAAVTAETVRRPASSKAVSSRLLHVLAASHSAVSSAAPTAAATAPSTVSAIERKSVRTKRTDPAPTARHDLLTPPPRANLTTEYKKRKASALQDAARACAATRATGFASAGFARSAHGHERLTQLLQQSVELDDYGAAHNTRTINETAWMHWTSFAEYIDFDPVLSPEQVRDHSAQIGTLLATFLLWIYPKLKGKHGRAWAKPRSAFAYVLAIIRIFKGWKLLLPPAKVVKNELHGLLRSFVNVYGVNALMPRRREPFRFSMICTMQDVASARLGNRSYDAHSSIGRAFRGILAVGWRTGHRLAEFVAHPSGELCYLTRANIAYVIGKVTVSDPTAAQLAQLRPGDTILIQPPRSKTDQFGEIHCPFPSSVPYSTDPHSAGFILSQQDRDHPCHGHAREMQPLFADEHDQPYTHAVMDRLLDQMLVLCFGSSACYSWHSMRIGLATALKAAGVDDGVIQMLCRWTSPESLRAYARHGQSLHIRSVDLAERATIDTVQMANVPRVCNTEGATALHLEFAQPISPRARAVLDAADDAIAHTPAPIAADSTPLHANTCVGRRVLVPAPLWPDLACTENGGAGWTAIIVASSRGAVTAHFTDALTARGLPYADVRLQLASVTPF